MFDDKKADSLSASQAGTKQPAADAAANEIPATRWRDWFAGVAQVYNAERESDTKYREESTAKKAAVNDFGTDQPIRGDDGEIKQQLASGDVKRDDARGVFSWLQGLFTFHRDGEESYKTEGPKNRRTTEWFKDEKSLGLGGLSSTLSGGKKVEIVDLRATGEAIQKQLEAEVETQRAVLERLQAGQAKAPSSKTLAAQIKAAQDRIAAAQTAIVTIKSDPTNRFKLKAICNQLGIHVEPTMKVVSEDSVTATEKLTRDGWKLIATDTTTVKETAQDGTINGKTGSTAQSFDFAAGTASKVDSESDTAQKTDHTSKTASKATTQPVSVGGGEVAYASSTTNANIDKNKNKKGETEFGTSSTLGGSASVLAGDNGIGLKGGVSATNATTKDGKTSTNDIAAHIAVTDNGVFRDASFAHKYAGKKVEGEIKVSHDGAITMVVTPPTDDDPSWHVVTTIRAGLKLDPSLGTKKPGAEAEEAGTKASGSLSANVGATMSYSHAMSEEQVEAYMGAAEQAEASRAASGGGSYPEFGVLQKLNLLAHGDASANPLAVLGSSSAATDIKPGDSVSLVLTAGAQAKLGGEQGSKDKGGAGIDASGSVTYTRTLSVTRDKDGTVVVTLGFVDADKLEGSLSGNFEGATGKVGASHEVSDGESYTFRLDPTQPDYQTCYGAITGKLTRESVKALYADPMMKKHAEKQTISDQHKDGHTVEMGVNVAGVNPRLAIGHEEQESKDVTVAHDGATGTIASSASDSATPWGVGGATQTNGVSSNVGAGGQMNIDFEQTDEASPSPAEWFRNVGTQIKGWFVKDDKPVTTRDILAGGLAKTPGERVKELLDKQYSRLSGYKVSPADVDTLFGRAIDSNKWMSAAASGRILDGWRQLRSALLDPDVDMSLVPDPSDALQLQKATKLAQAQALADFMHQSGSDGYDAYVRVLREYGATLQRESTADDLGTRYEWPESLSKYRVMYEAAAAKADQIPALFGELTGKPDGARKWHAMTDKQITALDAVHAAIAASKDIYSERARAEMLDACSTKKAQFTAAAKYFDRAATPADPTMAPRTEASEAEVGATLFAQARIPALLTDLAGFKMKERELFQQGEAALVTWFGQKDALPVMSQLRELYEFWVAKVKELRRLYTIAKVPQDQWQVSTGPSDRRHAASTEPYADGMIKIYKEAGGDDYNTKVFAADWHERWTSY